MPRIQMFCHECNDSMDGEDGAVCRYCHEVFCEGCGDTGVRVCDSCADEEAEAVEYIEKQDRKEAGGGVVGDDEEVEDEYGDLRDVDYFGG